METNDRALTREELSDWAHLQTGGSAKPTHSEPQRWTSQMGTYWVWNVAIGGWSLKCDPLFHIQSAWHLLPLIAQHGNLATLKEFEASLAALMYLKDSGPSIATLICCTAYFVVEGVRVTIREGGSDG